MPFDAWRCLGGGELQAPRLVKKDDIWLMLPATTKTLPSIRGDSELLRMDIRKPASGP
jgi:hypothetical protein